MLSVRRPKMLDDRDAIDNIPIEIEAVSISKCGLVNTLVRVPTGRLQIAACQQSARRHAVEQRKQTKLPRCSLITWRYPVAERTQTRTLDAHGVAPMVGRAATGLVAVLRGCKEGADGTGRVVVFGFT